MDAKMLSDVGDIYLSPPSPTACGCPAFVLGLAALHARFLRPSQCEQVCPPRRFVAELALEIHQGAWVILDHHRKHYTLRQVESSKYPYRLMSLAGVSLGRLLASKNGLCFTRRH